MFSKRWLVVPAAFAAFVVTGAAVSGPAASASTAASTYTLFTEPDSGYTTFYDFINSANTSLDMTMYELVDTTAEQDLANAAARGVKVRVILDQNLEKSNNTTAYNFLSGHGVSVVWANTSYAATHQKTITVDNRESLITTANLTSRYYSTGREFGVYDTDANDVSAVEKVFNADFAGSSVNPGDGDDLVWSPTDSQTQLLALINKATKSLDIENEEMADPTVTTALENAAQRGVTVHVTMTNTSNEYATEFDALTSAGVSVATYASSASLYIHAKVIIADNGTSAAKVFIGSENFSNNSLNKNRELGLILTDPTILSSVESTLTADHQGGTIWS
jgi:phosphatidylserine/phosphatidylglycerophosphate/cardiolipin synthase-like enzyme